jgi:23S rRNA (uracil1939-C5)-methyltransferase
LSKKKPRINPDPVEVTVDSLSHDGRGVAHPDGKAIFIDGALPGERIRFQYTVRHRRYDEGRVLEILEPSKDRVTPKCPHFGVCGGCSLQHLAPAAQIAAKQDILLDNLRRIGHVRPEKILAPLQADVWQYRNRARLSARYVRKKESLLVGFREKRSAFVTDMSRCEILNKDVGYRIDTLRDVITSLSIREFIPQIEIAAGDAQTCLIFRVLRSLSVEDTEKLKAFGKACNFTVMVQPDSPDSVYTLNDGVEPLYYDLERWKLRMRFEAPDFTQVNMGLNRRMLGQAIELLNPEPADTVLDLFCGLGNFSLPLARHTGRVVGVEGDATMVRRAGENACLNGIDNVSFHVADLFQTLEKASKPVWLQQPITSVLLDPPRTGALEAVQWLPALKAKRILYVSCNPATLARDAEVLVHQGGYRLTQAGVMDMFPHTAHVEAMALFEY